MFRSRLPAVATSRLARRGVAGAAAAWLALAPGCESRHTDGNDLHGVFTHSAPPPSATTADARNSTAKARRPSPSASAVRHVAPLVRRPPPGPCVALAGTPLTPSGRTARRPACRHARVLEWRDRRGAPRYGCVFAPSNLAARAPLPLLIFFHDEYDSPTAVHRKTRLRAQLSRYDMTGVPAHRGFVVLAPQGRHLVGKLVFDSGYTGRDNPDIEMVDHFVDVLAADGSIDGRQIYAVGAGGGGRMAALYSMLRPGRVAAIASYAGRALPLRYDCSGDPAPAAVVYRACDSVVPCSDVEQWIDDRRRRGAPTLALRLGAGDRPEPSCALGKARCRAKTGQVNHARWPKGAELQMLDYLSRYSLAAAPRGTEPAGADAGEHRAK